MAHGVVKRVSKLTHHQLNMQCMHGSRVEYGLTSHQTHYRSLVYARVYGVDMLW